MLAYKNDGLGYVALPQAQLANPVQNCGWDIDDILLHCRQIKIQELLAKALDTCWWKDNVHLP
jgi:hypothetical protein